ncbi:hypothetical protein MNBD_ALPHA03-87 [hydrothermal vent metagenome]|uniref:DUF6468 domain-containing protein n=1 Tax=hydrothermal vent metagenome TaxID=652676 RepID=A0A3B1ADA6_9ZZZZ
MELVIDSVIIILIIVMISYAVVLNIKLKVFRNAQNEMANLVNKLNEAISQAQKAVDTLKKAAQTEEIRLEGLVTKSRFLADELEIIIQSGSNLADRIERGLIPAENVTLQNFDAEGHSDEDLSYAEMSDEEDNEMLETLKKVR